MTALYVNSREAMPLSHSNRIPVKLIAEFDKDSEVMVLLETVAERIGQLQPRYPKTGVLSCWHTKPSRQAAVIRIHPTKAGSKSITSLKLLGDGGREEVPVVTV